MLKLEDSDIKNKLTVRVILILALLLVLSTQSYPTDIISCQNIDSPGYYKLTNNIVNATGICFYINSSDVILDLNGFTVDMNSSDQDIGVYINYTHNNITIINGSLTDLAIGIHINITQNISNPNISINNMRISSFKYGIDYHGYSKTNGGTINITNTYSEGGTSTDSQGIHITRIENVIIENTTGKGYWGVYLGYNIKNVITRELRTNGSYALYYIDKGNIDLKAYQNLCKYESSYSMNINGSLNLTILENASSISKHCIVIRGDNQRLNFSIDLNYKRLVVWGDTVIYVDTEYVNLTIKDGYIISKPYGLSTYTYGIRVGTTGFFISKLYNPNITIQNVVIDSERKTILYRGKTSNRGRVYILNSTLINDLEETVLFDDINKIYIYNSKMIHQKVSLPDRCTTLEGYVNQLYMNNTYCEGDIDITPLELTNLTLNNLTINGSIRIEEVKLAEGDINIINLEDNSYFEVYSGKIKINFLNGSSCDTLTCLGFAGDGEYTINLLGNKIVTSADNFIYIGSSSTLPTTLKMKVINGSIYGPLYGVHVDNVDPLITLNDIEIQSERDAFMYDGRGNATILNTILKSNSDSAIYTYRVNKLVIKNTTLEGNIGVYLAYTDEAYISNSYFSPNNGIDIHLRYSTAILYGNNLSSGSKISIYGSPNIYPYALRNGSYIGNYWRDFQCDDWRAVTKHYDLPYVYYRCETNDYNVSIIYDPYPLVDKIEGVKYPTNPLIYLDGYLLWNYSGEYHNVTNIHLLSVLQRALYNCTPDSEGYCNLKIKVYSDSRGIIALRKLNITYMPPPKIKVTLSSQSRYDHILTNIYVIPDIKEEVCNILDSDPKVLIRGGLLKSWRYCKIPRCEDINSITIEGVCGIYDTILKDRVESLCKIKYIN